MRARVNKSSISLPNLDQAFFFSSCSQTRLARRVATKPGRFTSVERNSETLFPIWGQAEKTNTYRCGCSMARSENLGVYIYALGQEGHAGDRLRQFPPRWRSTWRRTTWWSAPTGEARCFILYHFKPTDTVPVGLEVAWNRAQRSTHGRFQSGFSALAHHRWLDVIQPGKRNKKYRLAS